MQPSCGKIYKRFAANRKTIIKVESSLKICNHGSVTTTATTTTTTTTPTTATAITTIMVNNKRQAKGSQALHPVQHCVYVTYCSLLFKCIYAGSRIAAATGELLLVAATASGCFQQIVKSCLVHPVLHQESVTKCLHDASPTTSYKTE